MTRPYLSNIPSAREDLEQVAQALEIDGFMTRKQFAGIIREIIDKKMWSHGQERRAPRKSITTPEKKRQMVDLLLRYPTASQAEIAAAVGSNVGRVSEAWHERKKPPPRGTLLLLALGFVGGLLLSSGEGRAADASLAFCSVYAREATRIDIMHTAPVSASVTDAYIEALALKVFEECVSILPALLPLPEGHRDLDSWVKDMQRMLISRSGTEPAGDAPERAEGDEGDEHLSCDPGPCLKRGTPEADEWCRANYQTYDPDDGTVIRRDSDGRRVPCPV